MNSKRAISHTEAVVSRFPKCNFCGRLAHYDGRTMMGPWANMCDSHFRDFGIGLGWGRGQRLVKKLTGKAVENPGLAWHRGRDYDLRLAMSGMFGMSRKARNEVIHRLEENMIAMKDSHKLEIPNPRPPAAWWARMYPRVKAAYPDFDADRLARITAGIWYGYAMKVRKEMIRKYG